MRELGPYRIVEKIGEGGMGEVYRAFHVQLEKWVAIKVMRSDKGTSTKDRSRFLSEAKLTAQLKHPNLVNVIEVDREGETDYLVMDFVEGEPLSSLCKKGKCSPRRALELMREIALAVDYAHGNDIIHRDLKPSNIMVEQKTGRPIVMDFGLAKSLKLQKGLTKTGEMIGTPQYMAPEQAEGKTRAISPATDVYALGAILYEMLTGAPAVPGTQPMEILYNIVQRKIVPPRRRNPMLAPDVEKICLKALEKEAVNRYPTAKAFAQDIERFLNGEMIGVRNANPFYKAAKWLSRNKKAFVLSALFVSIALGFLYHFRFAPAMVSIHAKCMLEGKEIAVHPQLWIDGKKYDLKKRNSFTLAPGKQCHFKLAMEACEEMEFSLVPSPGESITLEKKMIRKTGQVSIASDLSGLEAVFRHTALRESFTTPVPVYGYRANAGKYEVTFRKQNYFNLVRTIDVRPEVEGFYPVNLEPMLQWKREVVDASSIQVADLNSDGKLELICTSRLGDITVYDLQTHEKQWAIANRLSAEHIETVLEDLDNDGTPEILVNHHQHFMVFNGKTHEEMFRFPDFWGRRFALGDANGDGYKELILFHLHHGISCWELRSRRALWHIPARFELENSCPPEWIDPFHLIYAAEGGIYILDIRNGEVTPLHRFDPRPLIDGLRMASLRNGTSVLLCYLAHHELVCLDVTRRSILWKFSHAPFRVNGMLVFDVERDGKNELFIQLDRLYCLDLESGKLLWEFETNDRPSTSPHLWMKACVPSVADLDGDATMEIVTFSSDYRIHVLDAKTGKKSSEVRLDGPIDSLILLDTDGDSRLEIVALASDQIFCIHPFQCPQSHVFSEVGQISAAGHLPDLNGDGHHEILLGNSSGEIACLDGRNRLVLWKKKASEDEIESIFSTDVDGDGKHEIIAATHNRVILHNREGEKIGEFTAKNDTIAARPIIADIDQDGSMEMLISGQKNGLLCLSARSLEVKWKGDTRMTGLNSQPHWIEQDNNRLIILPATHRDPENRQEMPFVFCIDGKSGKVRWKTFLPFPAASAPILVSSIDGVQWIFAPQIGNVSALEAREGKVVWNSDIQGGVCQSLVLADADGNGSPDILVCSSTEDLHCLDARSGRLAWRTTIFPKITSAFETNLEFFNGAQILELKKDIDGDGLSDFALKGGRHSFYLFSGKGGKPLARIDQLGNTCSELVVQDMDGDARPDMIFIDEWSHLSILYDSGSYFERFLRIPQFFGNRDQDSSYLYLHRFYGLARDRAYERLERELSARPSGPGLWKVHLDFLQVLCLLGRREVDNALAAIERLRKECPDFRESRYLNAVVHLNRENPRASFALLKPMFQDSLLEFEEAHRAYSYFLSQRGEEHLRNIWPRLIQESRCDEMLDMAYRSALFARKPEEAGRFLEMFLRYSTPSSENYARRRKTYLERVLYKVEKTNLYIARQQIEILDKALIVLPDSWELRRRRGEIYFLLNISDEKALVDFQESLRLNPDQLDLHLFCSGLLLHAPNQALEILDRVEKKFTILAPKERTMHKILKALALGKTEEARQMKRQNVEWLEHEKWFLMLVHPWMER